MAPGPEHEVVVLQEQGIPVQEVLAVREAEYSPLLKEAGEATETYHCIQEDTRNMRTDPYVIMVFDHNIMQEEYEELLPRYQ